ncbi:hypothetical protein RKD30_000786 [Streptomyces pristinaespiralis]
MKFIQAHQIAKNTSAYTEDPVADVSRGELVLEGRGGLGDGHDETQVEEELQRGGGAMALAREAGDHRPVPCTGGGV